MRKRRRMDLAMVDEQLDTRRSWGAQVFLDGLAIVAILVAAPWFSAYTFIYLQTVLTISSIWIFIHHPQYLPTQRLLP